MRPQLYIANGNHGDDGGVDDDGKIYINSIEIMWTKDIQFEVNFDRISWAAHRIPYMPQENKCT